MFFDEEERSYKAMEEGSYLCYDLAGLGRCSKIRTIEGAILHSNTEAARCLRVY